MSFTLPKEYKRPDSNVWTGRSTTNSQPQYFHQVASTWNLTTNYPGDIMSQHGVTVGVIGYDCNEGVRRNGGRTGRLNRGGPQIIKTRMASLPLHRNSSTLKLLDCGDMVCLERDMEGCQRALGGAVSHMLNHRVFPIALGGGHDIAYGHYLGIRGHLGPEKTIGIINFDAHFDLRTIEGQTHSGTPFHQIHDAETAAGRPFHYLALGIQEQGNIPELFERSENFGAKHVLLDDFTQANLAQVKSIITEFARSVDHIYVTFDMDGVSSAYGAATSAANPFGFDPLVARSTLRHIFQTGQVISCDFAEFNPGVAGTDEVYKTSKLAAGLIHGGVIKSLLDLSQS